MRYAAILLFLLCPALAQIETKNIVPISVTRKAALVIGNSNYSRLEPIPAASFDADDVAASLRALGFEVTVRKDLGVDALISAIAAFSQTQVHAGDLALIYYSGHGGSVGEENYLLPVDYDPPSDVDLVETHAYAMSKVRDKLEGTRARVRLLIFDACRGPAVRSKGESEPRPIEGAVGTLIAFASAHKQDALFDASRRNSLYTGQLLAVLRQPGEELKGLLEDVQRRVYQETNHRQTPYLYGFLSGPLYLAGGPPAAAPGRDLAAEQDLAYWNSIKDSSDRELFAEYLQRFPNGLYRTIAERRMASLAEGGSAPAPAAASVAPSLPARATKVNPKDGLTYVWIPPGTFTMGCSPGDTECDDVEKPAHEVTITKGFWLGQPVTQRAYQRVTKQNPSRLKGANLPVESVTWDESRSYCAAIGGRLPTEAEWEYAAKAGSTGAGANLDAMLDYVANGGITTHKVGRKEANAFGLFDMLGSVRQWTADWYGDYQSGAQNDPSGPESGQYRALRGGPWVSGQRDLRVSFRSRGEPSVSDSRYGFRCVWE